MTQYLPFLLVFGLMGAWWFRQQKLAEAQGGGQGILDKADRVAFGLAEDEKIAKRWDAMFYMGRLVPETMLSVGEKISNFLDNTYVRGRHIRIGLTTTNRVVFSAEPEDSRSNQDAPNTWTDFSAAVSKGFRPMAVVTSQSAPRIIAGQVLFGNHPEWDATIRGAPSAMIDPTNWMAKSRNMTIARLDNMPDGRSWTIWIDPEAGQFLSTYGGS